MADGLEMNMRNGKLLIYAMLALLPTAVCTAIEREKAQAFVGQDLNLTGHKLLSWQVSTGEHTLVFQDGFSMSIGSNQFSSDSAVVWLKSVQTESRGRVSIDYSASVYIQGNLSVKKAAGAMTTDLSEMVIEKGKSETIRFGISGEVFVTADERENADPTGLELYKKAEAAMTPVTPKFIVQPEALVPEFSQEKRPSEGPAAAEKKPSVSEKKAEHKKKHAEMAAEPQAKEPAFRYPINIAPAGEAVPNIESAPATGKTDVATIIGRFYLWQKRDEKGGLLELQADDAVLYYSSKELSLGKEQTGAKDVLAKGAISAIYMCGDVVMTEGQRTIRADELYYDFQQNKAIAVNAEMKDFDARRGIPIYIRAAKLRRVAENQFAAEKVTVTNSEFHTPQVSLNAASVIITDTTTVDAQAGKVSDSSFDAQMQDVQMKAGDTTIFGWPFVRSNLERSDMLIKNVKVGNDNVWGTSLETRWYLARLLGLKEPEGTDSTLDVDYYSKRGLGAGPKIDYKGDDYYGKLIGYVINDSGEDRLGRYSTRRDIKPDNELRGRFFWQHRQFLPSDWQLTVGVGYASDKNFLESYYRNEFNSGVQQETYVHLKHIQDNEAISILGKGRINDYADELEEVPSVEYHLTGQSLFDDKFTLYNDTQVSRLRQRIGDDQLSSIPMDKNYYSFLSQRVELDMPIQANPFKIVPFVAGTFGYDDRSGFTSTLVDGSDTGSVGEDQVWLGEAGVRVFPQAFWKVYPDAESRLWDINQLRHIIQPELTAVVYGDNTDAIEQRNILNMGVSQRLQTKRGTGDRQETVDWMRLDTDVTFVSHPEDASDAGPGPDRFIWNEPSVPLRVLSAPEIFNGDLKPDSLRRIEMYGVGRNYFGADYVWRVSNTAAVLSNMNFDLQSSVVQQFDIGISRLCWPNLSYYIGSRYLKRVEILDEKGSDAFIFAATYVIDPRYTVVFAQQFDFDYGANVRSDFTLIRRYNRMFCSFTVSADASLDRKGIVFSIWPQGVPEMALGERRYTGIGGSGGY